ncbi:MAG: serine/threonine protein kinase [Planctomycetia bacterium]|nr:serine/threonine protein kinase [Planctomycetia bacterium]
MHDTPSFSQGVVGDYELISQIAQGGMGIVYKARQISLNREVALKMVPASNYANEVAIDRFRVEAEAVAALDHSNIIPIYEVGEFQGQPFYSMKLVGKGNLADRLKSHDPREGVESLIQILEKVCRAVQHAHERGVIHRDLKPSNILLEKPDQPMLADFGLAKRSGQDATLTGMILGTPRYMAPEQAAGQAKSATTRTDVYSLGVILYEILTGRPPYLGDDPIAVAMQVVEAKPEPPSQLQPGTDRGLEAICLKCLAKDPDDRYTSAAVLADDLAHWLAGEPISVRPPNTSRQVLEWLRKHSSGAIRLITIGMISGLIMSIAMMIVFIPQVMTSSEQSLEKFPSVAKPLFLRWLDWKSLREIPEYVVWLMPIIALFSWIMQGPLIMLLLRPRASNGALALGLGCGTISGITACFSGVAQTIVLANAIVPQIENMRCISLMGFDNSEIRANARKELLERLPDLQKIPDMEQSGAFLGYLVSMQVLGIFEGVMLALLFVFVLGMTSVVCQTLVAYYLSRREKSSWYALMYYVEFVTAFLFLIAYPIHFETNLLNNISWLWCILACAVAIVGAIHRWGLILRLGLYVLCLLGLILFPVGEAVNTKPAWTVYLLFMLYFAWQVIRSWRQFRKTEKSTFNDKALTLA